MSYPEQDTAISIRSKATQAIGVNNAFLSLASPSAAQVTAQVRVLTRECNALIRLMVAQLDADDA
jgi:hypothetical protein